MTLTTWSLYSWDDLASLFPAGTGGRRAAEQRQRALGDALPGTGLSQGAASHRGLTRSRPVGRQRGTSLPQVVS